jgi:putative oxidoreductase
MPVMDKLKRLRTGLMARVKKLEPLAPLLARLTIGVVFMTTGWGKLHSLDKVTEFFTELHLPAPHFQAILVATTECVGGLFIILGLLTRLTALPLAITMVVAIISAKRGEIEGISSLLGLSEFMYLIVFLWLAIAGPGQLSIDRLIGKRLDSPASTKP